VTPPDYGDWTDVRAYNQPVALGDGSVVQDYVEAHRLKFRTRSLQRKGLWPDSLCVYYGSGDSMWPRVRDGDAVLFDTSDTRPRDGRLFVVQLSDTLSVKRCEIIDDLAFFRADNPDGDHQWKKPRRMDNIRDPITILGRVRWIGSWED
jgi:phage repressor protein C with HTH and peptisase S24 domain